MTIGQRGAEAFTQSIPEQLSGIFANRHLQPTKAPMDARLAAARLPAGLAMYGAPYAPANFPGYLPYGPAAAAAVAAADPAAFYSSMGSGENADVWRAGITHAAAAAYYDPAMAAHYGYGYGPMGLNDGARRKNATRETTSTLKAWLNEHRKNPYPTKGEKIMLAIITKMTLTQVSTWFANARRRLKKENKMTWSPRNRCGEDDDDDDLVDSHHNHDSRASSPLLIDAVTPEPAPATPDDAAPRFEARFSSADDHDRHHQRQQQHHPFANNNPPTSSASHRSDDDTTTPSRSGKAISPPSLAASGKSGDGSRSHYNPRPHPYSPTPAHAGAGSGGMTSPNRPAPPMHLANGAAALHPAFAHNPALLGAARPALPPHIVAALNEQAHLRHYHQQMQQLHPFLGAAPPQPGAASVVPAPTVAQSPSPAASAPSRTAAQSPPAPKPKIWSIADVMTRKDEPKESSKTHKDAMTSSSSMTPSGGESAMEEERVRWMEHLLQQHQRLAQHAAAQQRLPNGAGLTPQQLQQLMTSQVHPGPHRFPANFPAHFADLVAAHEKSSRAAAASANDQASNQGMLPHHPMTTLGGSTSDLRGHASDDQSNFRSSASDLRSPASHHHHHHHHRRSSDSDDAARVATGNSKYADAGRS